MAVFQHLQGRNNNNSQQMQIRARAEQSKLSEAFLSPGRKHTQVTAVSAGQLPSD